jgi:PAS domain S-box-containing protein
LSKGINHLSNYLVDAILLDLTLPDSTGIDTFLRLQAHAAYIPIILMTGLDDENLANKAVREGAQDYLVKGQTDGLLLEKAIRYAIERKQAEEALKQSEVRYRRLVESVTDYIYSVKLKDQKAIFMEHGPGSINITGFSPEEYKNDPNLWYRRVYAEDRQKVIEREERAIRGESVSFLEHRIVHKDGTVRWVRNTLVMRYDEGKYPTEYDAMIVDITETKQAEQKLYQLNSELEQRVIQRTAQLEATNKELEAFVYSVSHDLRSPLRTIGAFSQILLEENNQLDKKSRDYIGRIHRAVNRMSSLIDNLLKLSRISQSELIATRVNLSEMVTHISTELQESQPGRKVEWLIAKDIYGNGDEKLLEVALTNLLSNAFKYTSHHPKAQIEFGKKSENDREIFFISDDGAGFNMNYANKLFGVFQRLHQDSEFEGTGIGLAIVRRIIQRHEGDIWAEGQVEKGATFFFTLGKI